MDDEEYFWGDEDPTAPDPLAGTFIPSDLDVADFSGLTDPNIDLSGFDIVDVPADYNEEFLRSIGIDPASLDTGFDSRFSSMSNEDLQNYIMGDDTPSVFNPAKDSQRANELIEQKAEGFEHLGGDATAGYRAPGATPSAVNVNGTQYGTVTAGTPPIAAPGSHSGTNTLSTTSGSGSGTGSGTKSTAGLGSLLPLLLLMLAMRRENGSTGAANAVIPALSATQRQTPYAATQRAPGYRPGQGGITYFNPVEYTPRMAAGGIADLGRGRLLHGPGDGVSDSIPARIGSDQPARLARGEYVMDARTVAALGNGSTDAGAERLDAMRKRILADDRKAKVGKDSKAYRHLKV